MLAALAAVLVIGEADLFLLSASGYLIVFLAVNRLGAIPDAEERRIFVVAYLFFTLLGVVLIIHHLHYYRTPFDAFEDDSLFYAWALQQRQNLLGPTYSSYERFLALVLSAGDALGLKSGVHLLLPVNWGVGAYTVVLSHRIALRVAAVRAPLGLLFSALLLNYSFTDITVHLYRDVYVAFFFCLTVLAALSGNYLQGYFYSLFAGLFRLPNGVLSFLVVSGRAIFEPARPRSLVAVSAILLVGLGAFLAYEQNLRVQRYDVGRLDRLMEDRLTTFREKSIESGGGVGFVNSLALPMRFVLNIPAQIIRPVRINDFYAPIKERFRFGRVLNHRSVGFAITTVSLAFLAGFYFNGMLLLWHSPSPVHRFFLATVIAVIVMLGFVSFLDRHRVVLIVLFPAMVAMNFSPWAAEAKRAGKFLLNRTVVGVAFAAAALGVSLW